MSKVLSVCVPSYNMERYLNRCIDSFLVPEVLDQLEIIIVNDGSTDGTLSIANEYKTKYPQSIVVIDKPNGHYGSCVNASLKVATGKYFRIVDADDWVDSNALIEFIRTLDTIEVDCVCSQCTTHNFKDNTLTTEEINLRSNAILDLNSCTIPIECMHMHNLTYALCLMKRINYIQTEGICYTDTEYVYLPLACSKDMLYIDISLYQYYIGRDDQSMNWPVLQKNYSHFIKVNERLLTDHEKDFPFNKNEGLIWSVLVNRLVFFETPSFLLNASSDKSMNTILRASFQELYRLGICKPLSVYKNRFLGMPYVTIWYHSPRLFKLISILFRCTFFKNRVMK